MRALRRGVHILSPDRKAGYGADGPFDQYGWDAERGIDLWMTTGSFGDRSNLGEIGRQAVHLPVPDNVHPPRHDFPAPSMSAGPSGDRRELEAALDGRQSAT
jgi:hypothetical protein